MRYLVGSLVVVGVVGLIFGTIVDQRPRLALALLAIVVVAGIIAFVFANLRFRRRGYRSQRHMRDLVRYEERNGGEVRGLTLDGEMLTKGPQLVRIPDETTWNRQMPQWAHGRRDEIVARIKGDLGTKNYRFVGADDA